MKATLSWTWLARCCFAHSQPPPRSPRVIPTPGQGLSQRPGQRQRQRQRQRRTAGQRPGPRRRQTPGSTRRRPRLPPTRSGWCASAKSSSSTLSICAGSAASSAPGPNGSKGWWRRWRRSPQSATRRRRNSKRSKRIRSPTRRRSEALRAELKELEVDYGLFDTQTDLALTAEKAVRRANHGTGGQARERETRPRRADRRNRDRAARRSAPRRHARAGRSSKGAPLPSPVPIAGGAAPEPGGGQELVHP